MVDYSRWDAIEDSGAEDEPREPGAKLCREMVDDPKARQHYLDIIKKVDREHRIKEALYEKRRAEEEQRITRKPRPEGPEVIGEKPAKRTIMDYARFDSIVRNEGVDKDDDDEEIEEVARVDRGHRPQPNQLQPKGGEQRTKGTASRSPIPITRRSSESREVSWCLILFAALYLHPREAALSPHAPWWFLPGALLTVAFSVLLNIRKASPILTTLGGHFSEVFRHLWFSLAVLKWLLLLDLFVAMCAALILLTPSGGVVHAMILGCAANRVIFILEDAVALYMVSRGVAVLKTSQPRLDKTR